MTSLFLLFSFGIFAQNQVRISYVSPDSIPSATLDFDGFFRYKIHENENSWRHQREKMATMGERIP